MYLKSIKLDGFKSFADKTIFDLNNGITAIVGPNGSGKSNIVDAIRWVLGEQSAKSLRGNGMTDVIFSGTEKRDAINRASVTLTFDNSDKYLNSDYTEIEVKRCVYKTGENEYYLNNSRVRLKDITDMFIDSGGGLDAFNIISQGSVTDIVNSKPVGRRQIFESAAGVLKYKKRKEESLRKLEKTKENLLRVKLIIDELSDTVIPLKEQSEVAKKYLEFTEELKGLEIALSAKDITDINNEYKNIKGKLAEINEKLEGFNNSVLSTKIEELKLSIVKNDELINDYNKKILDITEELSSIQSEKNITMERSTYKYSKDEIATNLINLKDSELNLKKEIDLLTNENKIAEESINNLFQELSTRNNELKVLTAKRDSLSTELNNKTKEKYDLENKYEILESNIANNEKVPYAIKNVLNNPRLSGIHNTIGNLISINDDYLIALDTSISSASNFIVVDNESSAKSAINYLKDNKLGRATFLPLNIIKPRYIDSSILNRLEQVNGYVGVLSNLVEYDSLYENIIKNQMGNIIVARDIDSMNLIGKIIEYKYRVVSLDGSIIHAGGSITGGTLKNNSNIFSKLELEKIKNNLNAVINEIASINKNLIEINKDHEILYNQVSEYTINYNVEKETINNKEKYLNELKEKYESISSQIKGINDLNNNKLDDTLEKLMVKFNKKTTEKELLEQTLNKYKNIKDDLNNKLIEAEKVFNSGNSEYRTLQNELTTYEVSLGKMDVKLDNLLLLLNEEYNITYEYAINNYELSIEESLARDKVSKLKKEIKSLGEVNIGSVKEYERLSTRYDFLVNQQNDLEISMNNLMDIINEMDEIMINKFKESFDKISKEFVSVFGTIFKGGKGELKLTDPDDYLNTGIEIVAVPPGKRLNNTSALSGGEKSLTAICLLFAILNCSTVPFIVLDEVEAALDEVNVDMFGEYLSKKKSESQFVLITHKKRMMEYADVLYGITMQELGISKVVGVKLESDLN